MNVYVVQSGYEGDVDGVFSTRGLAEAYVNGYREKYPLSSHMVSEVPVDALAGSSWGKMFIHSIVPGVGGQTLTNDNSRDDYGKDATFAITGGCSTYGYSRESAGAARAAAEKAWAEAAAS